MRLFHTVHKKLSERTITSQDDSAQILQELVDDPQFQVLFVNEQSDHASHWIARLAAAVEFLFLFNLVRVF